MKHGFTLIELLSVLTIMAIVLSMATFSVIGWGRSTGMRAALETVERGLAMARQRAVTFREPTAFVTGMLDDGHAYFVITNAAGRVGDTNVLSGNIDVVPDALQPIRFTPRGTLDTDDRTLVLHERQRGAYGMTATILVYRVTGNTKVLQ